LKFINYQMIQQQILKLKKVQLQTLMQKLVQLIVYLKFILLINKQKLNLILQMLVIQILIHFEYQLELKDFLIWNILWQM